MNIQFDDKIRTGITQVDEQHAQLIEIYNELDDAFRQGKAHRQMSEILARLYQYTKEHFRDEERLLERHGFGDLAHHRHEHERLAKKLRKFVVRYRRSDERISAEVVEVVRAWIHDHIMECDHEYVDHVKRSIASVPVGAAD